MSRRLRRRAITVLAAAALHGPAACSSSSSPSAFHAPDGSVTDGATSDQFVSGDELSCAEFSGPVYCSATLGPVGSLDAAGAGVVTPCTSSYPSCIAPDINGSGQWLCCAECSNPPLIACPVFIGDAGADGLAGDASDASTADAAKE